MTHLMKEIFTKGTYCKLKYKKIKPCRFLKNIFDNYYKLELSKNFEISLIFSVVDLYDFHEGEMGDEEDTLE